MVAAGVAVGVPVGVAAAGTGTGTGVGVAAPGGVGVSGCGPRPSLCRYAIIAAISLFGATFTLLAARSAAISCPWLAKRCSARARSSSVYGTPSLRCTAMRCFTWAGLTVCVRRCRYAGMIDVGDVERGSDMCM